MSTTVTSTEPELFELWLDHPIVRQAFDLANDPDSLLDILESLHAVLTELDERFPGLPYRTLFEATRASTDDERRQALRTMKSAGVKLENRNLVVPHQILPPGHDMPDALAECLLTDPTWEQVVAAGWAGTKRTAYEVLRIKQPLSRLERALLADLDKPGATLASVSRRHGSSANTVRTARRKREYRQYLERRKAAAA